MTKKHIICTSLYNVDDWQDAFEEYCESNELDKDKEDIYQFIEETLAMYAEDEVVNLNIDCGDIIAIADLGLWDGRHSAYQMIKRGKVNGIFDIKLYDEYEFYCDQYNVKADIYHHDGCNHITFREVISGKNNALERLQNALYNQEEVTAEMIRRCTRSLRPYVKKCYGF